MPKKVTKDILRALGYTPKTLAADIGVSTYQARRILSEEGTLYAHELFKLCEVTGIGANVLCGMLIPGKSGNKDGAA